MATLDAADSATAPARASRAGETAVAMQRVNGAARLSFRRNEAGHSALSDLYQRAPCRLLFPQVEPGEPPQAVLLTTSGGLTGGDRIDFELVVHDGAAAMVTTQAAEKLYRALPGEADTQIATRLHVGHGGWAEYLAQETILFEGARLRRSLEADLAADARLLVVESLVFGRGAMQERYTQGRVHDAWRIRRQGRLVWADALRLEGEIDALRAAPFGFGTALASATLLYAGPDASSLLGEARRLLADAGPGSGATAFDDLLIVRLLADDGALLRQSLMQVAAGLRQAAAGLPNCMPRVWQC